MEKIIDTVEAEIKKVLKHESIKAADAAITISALRSGGKGYTGELIQIPLRKMAREIVKQTIELISHDVDVYPENGVPPERRRISIIKRYMERYDAAQKLELQ